MARSWWAATGWRAEESLNMRYDDKLGWKCILSGVNRALYYTAGDIENTVP